MRPILFHIGSVEIPSYLTMVMFGFFAAVFVMRRRGESLGMDGVVLVDLGIFVFVMGVVGARLLAVLTDGALADFVHLCTEPTLVDPVDTAVRFCRRNTDCGFDYLCNTDAKEAVLAGTKRSMCYPPRDCLAVFKFWQGGLTFYGGLLLAIPTGFWLAKRRKLDLFMTADVVAPSLMLGLAIGRWGCFLNGCCYGSVTDSRLGMHFPHLSGLRHPTQLYESVAAFLLFFVLRYALAPRLRVKGELFGWLLSLYGGVRMSLELFRDDPRGSWAWLSTSQIISVPLVLLGLAWIIWTRRRAEVYPEL